MKSLIALAFLPAIAVADPLLVSINSEAVDHSGVSIQAGECVNQVQYCGSYLMSSRG